MKSGPAAPEEGRREAIRRGRRWLGLGTRLAGIGAGAWLVLQLPLPLLEEWLPVRNVGVAIAAILLAGKALYDTLFYDHYWP